MKLTSKPGRHRIPRFRHAAPRRPRGLGGLGEREFGALLELAVRHYQQGAIDARECTLHRRRVVQVPLHEFDAFLGPRRCLF